MKKLIAIFILSIFSSNIYAANEINSFVVGTSNAFAVVRNGSGQVWYVSGQAWETWGTDGRDADHYDIVLMGKSGGLFVGNFDTNISAGNYHIVTHLSSDATPDDNDPAAWQEYGYWSGTVWQPYTLKTLEDKIDIIDTNVDDIETDTGTTIPALIADVNDNIESYIGDVPTTEEIRIEMDSNSVDFNTIIEDTHELQTDWTNGGRLDVILDSIKAMTDLITILDTTVAEANDANSFTLTAGIDVNDAFDWCTIMVIDADDSHTELRSIVEWEEDRVLIVEQPFGFTPAVGDVVHIMGVNYDGLLEILMAIIQYSDIPTYIFDYTTPSSSGGGARYDVDWDDP